MKTLLTMLMAILLVVSPAGIHAGHSGDRAVDPAHTSAVDEAGERHADECCDVSGHASSGACPIAASLVSGPVAIARPDGAHVRIALDQASSAALDAPDIPTEPPRRS